MSEKKDNRETSESPSEKIVHGMMAEFTTVDTLIDACNRVREAGYKRTDAYTPFPVHGIDKALGIPPTVLPWIALAAGLTGTTIALAMQIWMNAIDYPYIISGKPYISLPAFMPVAFELTILLASFGAFFGMWALNGLPRFSNPMFTDPRFDRATDDRFFLYIDAKDDRYNAEGVRKLFDETGSQYINEVVEDDSPKKVPRAVFMIWGLMVAFSVIPVLIVLKMRVTKSSQPRFHVFYDMDFSPARDAQQTTSLFADNRASRPDVPGTVSRGQIGEDIDTLTGIDMEELARVDAPRAERLVRTYLLQEDDSSDDAKSDDAKSDDAKSGDAKSGDAKSGDARSGDQSANSDDASDDAKPKSDTEPNSDAESTPAPPAAPSVMDTTPWLNENPFTLDADLLTAGQDQFNIYCAVCHGRDGRGNGLVNQRAQKIMADTWVPPASMHDETLYDEKYPDGKLFSTISNGIRKMPGYAGQIKLKNRWAIVAYVRALQKSQNASIDLVPTAEKSRIEKEQAAAKKAIEEAEAKAKKKAEEAKAEAEKNAEEAKAEAADKE